MDNSDIPIRFPIPFANAAGGGFIRPIPETSQILLQDGAASLETGFPPLNFLPVGAGGVPPFGQDMNGLLKRITEWVRWQNAGAPVPHEAAFSTTNGGYPKGSILIADVPDFFWLSTVENNTSDPDAGGAGWLAISPAGLVTGQCYLTYVDATHVALMPYNGSSLVINGIGYRIPAAGAPADITNCTINGLAGQAVNPNQTYSVFMFGFLGSLGGLVFFENPAFMPDTADINRGIMVLNLAGAPQSSHSFVGMVRTNASAQLAGQGVGVSSWFNRRPTGIISTVFNTPITSTTHVEISEAARISYLSYARDDVTVHMNAIVSNSVVSNFLEMVAAVNGFAQGYAVQVRVPSTLTVSATMSLTKVFPGSNGIAVFSPLGLTTGGIGNFDTLETNLIVQG